MANIFTYLIIITTLTTGSLWFLDKFVTYAKRYKYQAITKITTNNQIDKKSLKKNRHKSCLLEIGASAFPTLAIVVIIRSFIYEPFQIPSGSMMPTLLIRDFILVEKFAYGIKDPIFQKTLIATGSPKRGDIVVFKYPENMRLDYVKRVIGLPKDKIIYNPVTKKVTIYPDCSSSVVCTNVLPITYSHIEPSNFVQTFFHKNDKISDFFQAPKDEFFKKSNIRLFERTEALGDITHRILTIPIVQDEVSMYYQQSGQKLASWIVPPGQYFMMGDNRDNSADSRYWGFVPESNLVGKVVAIWMSFEKQKNEWPIKMRLNRIGLVR